MADNDTSTDPPADAERRSYERAATHHVQSLLGKVVDISPGGMRVEHDDRARFRVNDSFDVVVWRGQCELLVTVRVAWTEQMGAGGQRLGLEFVSNGPQLPRVVAELAREGCGQLVGPQCWLAA
jgi:hypothetical protein